MDSGHLPAALDQDWINYQQEIAIRHTSVKKNQVDGVQSTPYVPLRDVIAFLGVMNQTIKPYLAAKGNTTEEDRENAHGVVQVHAVANGALGRPLL